MKTTERKVLVKEIQEELKSSGGIILDRGQTSKFKKGTVLSVGDVVKNVKEGDVVHYDGYRASDIIYKGDTLKVLEYGDIVIVE